jgi:hypothetical protein
MFGMLDYRAHKLYVLLYTVPLILLRLAAVFLIPAIAYGIGLNYGSSRVWQITIGIGSIFLVEIGFVTVQSIFGYVFKTAFNFFIDVVPANGRSEEEAKLVLWNGEAGINLLVFERPASEWNDEDIEIFAKKNSFLWMFRQAKRDRMHDLRDYYISNPEIGQSQYSAEMFFEEHNRGANWLEQLISNRLYREWAARYVFMLYLLIADPFGN